MTNKYPTPKQIMEKPVVKYAIALVGMVKEWKKQVKLYEIKKFYALHELVDILYRGYTNKPFHLRTISRPYIVYKPNAKSCSYSPIDKTIYINKSLSIISTMHEFAHFAYGPDELQACRWSVQLFKKVFPDEFKKLVWKGHMLIKAN